MKINLAEIDDTQASYIRNMGDDAAKHFPIHDLTLKWNKMQPIFGERYESTHQLKNYLINYVIHKGYSITFIKCEGVKLVARCGSKNDKIQCPYIAYASQMTEEKSFQVKRLVDKHNVKNIRMHT